MSIIEESLREEEKIGGFQPEADEESFLLNENAYEGDIPDFSQEVEELNDDLIRETSDQEDLPKDDIAEAELIDTPENGSVWDQFENDETQEETPSDDSAEKDSEPEQVTDDEEAEEQAEPQDASGDADEEALPPDLNDLDEDEDIPEATTDIKEEDEIPPSEAETFEDKEEKPTSEEDIFDDAEQPPAEAEMSDDDLKSFLTEELERSKKYKEEKAAKGDTTQETDPDVVKTSDSSDFKAVDDSDDAIEIDLSTFNIDSYSKNKEKQEKAAVSEKTKEQPEKKAKKEKKKKPPKEKKERKPLPAWVPIAVVAAILLLVSSIGGYYLYNYNKFFGLFDSSSMAQDSTDTSKEEKDIAVKDTLKEAEKDIADDEIQQEDTAQDTTAVETEEPVVEEQDKKYTENENIADSRRTVSSDDKDFRTLPKVKKPKSKSDNKYKNPDIINNTKQLPFSFSDEERGVYTVQVYSTLSENDALDWLKKLKSKNIASAFISTQKIRDKVWYRVRFGAFTTKNDAKEAAAEYGFAQSWIDRVK